MYLSIRDEIAYAAGYRTIADALKDLDIPGVELWVRRDLTVPALDSENGDQRIGINSQQDLRQLQASARAHGITISSLCMGNNFNADDKAFEQTWAATAVRAAATLEAPVVRMDAIMTGETHMPLPERRDIVATAVSRILEETSDTGVDIGIENHGYQGNDPEFITDLLAQVDSPRLGLTLDSGNFYWRGWPLSRVYEIFEQFARVVKHTHIKNIRYPAEIRETQREMGYEYGKYVSPIHAGDIDHARYIRILEKAGYDRDICLEDESFGGMEPEARQASLRAAADMFRDLMGTTSGSGR